MLDFSIKIEFHGSTLMSVFSSILKGIDLIFCAGQPILFNSISFSAAHIRGDLYWNESSEFSLTLLIKSRTISPVD